MQDLIILLLAIYGASANSKIHLIPSHIICPEVTKDHDILLPDPVDCTVFYKCENGAPVPQTCPPGFAWCQELSKCTMSMFVKCIIGKEVVTYSPDEIKHHPVICPENGVTIPDPTDCTSYFICSNYTQKIQHCPSDYEYSCWIGDCVRPEVSNCIINNIQEGKPCPKNGKRLQNLEDCGSYYECIHGKATLRYCKHGEKYNAWHERCVQADYAQCQEYKTNITTTPTTSPAEPEKNICPTNGILLPDSMNCSNYYICKNNTPIHETCPDNLAYSCWDQECINPVEAECFSETITIGSNCTIEGLQLYDPYNCSSYYVCINGKTEKRTCDNDLQYNKWYGKCVTSNVSYCTPETTTTTTVSTSTPTHMTPNPDVNICPVDGILLPDHEHCNMYYECINNKPVSKTCPNNLVYSCWDQECIPATAANCIQNNQVGQHCNEEGLRLPNIYNCDDYYECRNNSVIQKNCKDGLQYNEWFSKCYNLEVAHCTSSSRTTTESTTTTMTPTSPQICPRDNVTLPNPFSCNSYYICKNGKVHTSLCPDNTEYSCWIGECMIPEVSNCLNKHDQNGLKCSVNGARLPNYQSCGSYYECIDGYVKKEQCADGTVYNEWTEECASDILCVTFEPITSPTVAHTATSPPTSANICPIDGIILPDHLNCSNFYICKNNTPIHETCPDNLAYSCWDQECINPVEAECFSETITIGSNCTIEGLQLYDPYNCSSYYVCINGKTEKRTCDNDLQYNKWYGKCVTSNVSYCTPETTTTTTVSTSTPTHMTPNPDVNICPVDGILLPDHEHCNMYYECINNKPVSKTCPNNLVYSCWDQKCIPATAANCIQNNQVGQHCNEEGLRLPNIYNCDDYYECSNNSVIQKNCKDGLQYNEWFSKCYNSEVAHCTSSSRITTETSTMSEPSTSSNVTISPSLTNCPVEGTVLADVTDCLGFYICTNGRPFHYDCPAPLKFNAWECQCQNTSAPICVNDTEIGKACKKHGYSLPVPNDCKCYYECVDGFIKKSCCSGSSEYNVWFKKCVSKELSHCSFEQSSNSPATPSPTTDICPKSGGLLPNPSNCSTYYECKDETPVLQQCDTGLQYSCWEQKCVPPKEANCLSLGSQTGKKCHHEGQRIQIPENCNSYYECSKEKVITKHCPWPLQYNKWFGFCVLQILSHCQSTSTTAKPTTIPMSSSTDICPVNGDTLPNINDCQTYYSCINTTPVVKNCAEGEKYSAWDLACLPKAKANCFTANDLGKNCSINGVRLPNTENCNSFYECVNGKVEKKYCLLFNKYNKWYKKCVSPSYAHCDVSTPSATTPTTETPPTNVVCPKEGTIVANPTDCSSYFECKKKPRLRRCPKGKKFDCWDQKCKKSGTARCITDQSAHEGNSCSHKGQKVPNVKNCKRYYECNGKTIENKRCPLLKQFSTWSQECKFVGFAHCANNKFLGII